MKKNHFFLRSDKISFILGKLKFTILKMDKTKRARSVWISILIIVLSILYFTGAFLIGVYKNHGGDKFIYTLILIFALFIGTAHIILFLLRKYFERRKTRMDKRIKRKLEKYRNIVNYITPFVLVTMLFHLWQRGWILATVVVIVLLLDRLNDLRLKNK